mmetsp:Transcript_43481/g.63729  ORF Transcript_43481/g.63729 Transcript_43481/m.63729 type:complete len:268 (+) Transcript_43481:2598-3401(+)
MDSGSSAYWMLHSPTMPRWRTTFTAVSRSMWYSLFVSVWLGASTIESPVCTPRGSKFSMLHTVMQLSAASRTTSYSTSFHPFRHFSTRICGARLKAFVAISRRCASSRQMPEPRPPSAKAERIMMGNPMWWATRTASSTVVTASDCAIFSSISTSFLAKMSRSSVASMTGICVPSTCTLYLARMPFFSKSTPQFSAVWPPMEITMPSGRSRLSTCSTNSAVTGRKYTWSAWCSDLSSMFVCTEAMFGFMSTTSLPSSFRALMACAPE